MHSLDGIRGEATSEDAVLFSRRHRLQISFSLDVDLHGVAHSKLVCSFWMQRMQFWLNQYIDNGDSWDDLLLEGFVEPDAVAEAFRAGSPELRKRISTCRDMMPRPVPP